MAARTIDGPEKDWLDMADLTHMLRLSENTIRRLIRDGEFPAPIETSKGSRMWLWSDVVYWTLRKSLAGRLLNLPPGRHQEQPGRHQEQPGRHQEQPSDEDTPSDP